MRNLPRGRADLHVHSTWSDGAQRPEAIVAAASGRLDAQGGLAVAAHPFHPVRGANRGQRSIGRLIPDLPLDAIEVLNKAGVFSAPYNAWAAPGTSSGCCP